MAAPSDALSPAPARVLVPAPRDGGEPVPDAPDAPVEDPGGSALLGGVMMRCGRTVGMAARRPDGRVETASFALPAPRAGALARVPVARGVLAVGASLNASLPALAWSFKVRFPHLPVPGPARMRRTAVAGLLVLDAVFSAVPALLAAPAQAQGFAALGAETALRLLLLVGYLLAVRAHPDVRELFAYHGAEHKTVAAYEARAALTVDQVRPRSLRHVRCGTGFVLWLVLAASAATPLVHGMGLAAGIGCRFLIVLAAAGVAYEVLRAGARWERVRAVRWLLAPGMALQRLTTSEPTDAQIEVGIAAMNTALAGWAAEQALARPGRPVPVAS